MSIRFIAPEQAIRPLPLGVNGPEQASPDESAPVNIKRMEVPRNAAPFWAIRTLAR